MANDLDSAIVAYWRQGLDRTFETIELMRLAMLCDLEELPFLVTANFNSAAMVDTSAFYSASRVEMLGGGLAPPPEHMRHFARSVLALDPDEELVCFSTLLGSAVLLPEHRLIALAFGLIEVCTQVNAPVGSLQQRHVQSA